MSDPTQPRNHDQDIPGRSGEDMGEREAITPNPGRESGERSAPLPEEETYERDRDERRRDEDLRRRSPEGQ